MCLQSACWEMITYSGSHIAQLTAEQGEDVILQHELHLVLINLFLCRERNINCQVSQDGQTQHSSCTIHFQL